jgi:hypothetical protein
MNGKFDFREQGHALVLVLIFSVLLSLLAISALESSSLQSKMSQNFEENLHFAKKERVALSEMESYLETEFHTVLPKGVSPRQFIPDTLHFNEQNGIDFYEIELKTSFSTIALRR